MWKRQPTSWRTEGCSVDPRDSARGRWDRQNGHFSAGNRWGVLWWGRRGGVPVVGGRTTCSLCSCSWPRVQPNSKRSMQSLMGLGALGRACRRAWSCWSRRTGGPPRCETTPRLGGISGAVCQWVPTRPWTVGWLVERRPALLVPRNRGGVDQRGRRPIELPLRCKYSPPPSASTPCKEGGGGGTVKKYEGMRKMAIRISATVSSQGLCSVLDLDEKKRILKLNFSSKEQKIGWRGKTHPRQKTASIEPKTTISKWHLRFESPVEKFSSLFNSKMVSEQNFFSFLFFGNNCADRMDDCDSTCMTFAYAWCNLQKCVWKSAVIATTLPP